MIKSSMLGSMVSDKVGPWPHPYFLPAPLSTPQGLREDTWELVAFAHAALGELSATVRILKPNFVSQKISMLQDALASSRIEGTQTTLAEVIEADQSESRIRNSDIEEVLNYQQALEVGYQSLGELPLSRRLACRIHEVLMSGARGITKTPGEFRTTPVWIGSRDSTPQNAAFIPPLPHHLTDLFAQWEEFANAKAEMSVVVLAALSHYQFETIHPFLDGNGRVGRILLELQLVTSGALAAPFLGVSRHIERFRDEYYSVLQTARIEGDVDSLIRFFAFAIETQARETTQTLIALIGLREQWAIELSSEFKQSDQLAALIVEQPILTVQNVVERLGVSQPTASKLLRRLQQKGILVSRGQLGQGRRETWIANQVWKLLSPQEAA
jgi:Fic family protein